MHISSQIPFYVSKKNTARIPSNIKLYNNKKSLKLQLKISYGMYLKKNKNKRKKTRKRILLMEKEHH